MTKVEKQIENFVAQINAASRAPIPYTDIPLSVRTTPADSEKWSWNWEIKAGENPWILPLQNRPKRWPRAFESLFSRFIFPAFEWRDLEFFANTPEGAARREFRREIFEFWSVCPSKTAPFLPFARPKGGDFDWICLDFSSQKREPCVVRIEHEALFAGEICMEILSDSFWN